MWKEIFEHVKHVAIDDFKLFFELYVWVWRGIRRFIGFIVHQIRCWLDIRKAMSKTFIHRLSLYFKCY